jgi:hypothetical protein
VRLSLQLCVVALVTRYGRHGYMVWLSWQPGVVVLVTWCGWHSNVLLLPCVTVTMCLSLQPSVVATVNLCNFQGNLAWLQGLPEDDVGSMNR